MTEQIHLATGRAFVQTYYKLMFQDPLALHKLYKSESRLSIGSSEEESPKIAQGADIKAQIESLQLKLPLVLVKSVDVVPTNDCILIAVVGTLQNEGEKPKQFYDTFVLAPQKPQGYFIRTHISRYIDFTEVPESDPVQDEPEVESPASTPEPDFEAPEPEPGPVEEVFEPVPEQKSEPAKPAPEPVPEPPAAAPVEPAHPVVPAPAPVPAKNNSWRDIVNRPGQPKKPATVVTVANPAPVSVPKETPAQEPAQSTESGAKVDGKGGKSPKPKSFNKAKDQRVVVVRNFLPTTTEETMHNFFTAYGKVLSVTLLGKSLAFIEFERAATATKVLALETPIVIDNKEVKVELKKRKPPTDKKASPKDDGGRKSPGAGNPRKQGQGRPPQSGGNPQGVREKREKPTVNKNAEL